MTEEIDSGAEGPESADAIAEAQAEIERTPLVKLIHADRYFARGPDGHFDLSQPLTERSADDYLISIKRTEPRSERNGGPRSILADSPDVPEICIGVMGLECVPNAGQLLRRHDGTYALNTWVRPKLVPAKGAWPRVMRVIEWTANHEPEGVAWFLNWLAYKMQNPGNQPGTAVLIQGPAGTGKNVVFRIFAQILGPENCAQIGEPDLAKEFNAHWANKLFVFANELAENHTRRSSLHNGLKALITDRQIWLEAKGIQRIRATNRLAILSATNNQKPLELDSSDRRWAVFHNRRSPIEPGPDGLSHRQFLESLHDPRENEVFTPEFQAEISAFAFDMRVWSVDFARVKRPHENEGRADLKTLSESPTDQFIRALSESPDPAAQIADWIRHTSEPGLGDGRIRGRPSYSSGGIYAAFRRFCEQAGLKYPPPQNTFSSALKQAGWIDDRTKTSRGLLPPWEQPDAATSNPLPPPQQKEPTP